MLDRVLAVVQSMPCADISAIQDAMGQMAKAIHEEDIAMCTAISEYGLSLVKAGDGILTHCNAGPLATSRYGTGLGPSSWPRSGASPCTPSAMKRAPYYRAPA